MDILLMMLTALPGHLRWPLNQALINTHNLFMLVLLPRPQPLWQTKIHPEINLEDDNILSEVISKQGNNCGLEIYLILKT